MSVRVAVVSALVASIVLAGSGRAAAQDAASSPSAASKDAATIDQQQIIAPPALDTPTPTPTPTATATASATPTQQPPRAVETPAGNNAVLRPQQAKQKEADAHCASTTSPLLAVGGAERVDHNGSWAWLPFLIAAACTAIVAGGYAVRRRRTPRREGESTPSLLEVAATIVAICAGVAGLAAQFIPGIGAHDAPAPDATMAVRSVNARITRGEFAQTLHIKAPKSALDRREIGDVIWLQLHLKGYRGKALELQWGSYEAKGGGALVPATTFQALVKVSRDSDEQTLFQPIWVGYPGLRHFQVQFRLLQNDEVRELASTGPMRGNLPRYRCSNPR